MDKARPIEDVCQICKGDRYILQGCCSGFECGCMGQPVAVSNCSFCNPDGSAEFGNDIKEYADHLEYINS